MEQPQVINSSMNGLKDRLDTIRSMFNRDYVNTLIGFFTFLLIVAMVVFGYFWKNMYLMKIIFILYLIFMVIFLAMNHFWYPAPETSPKAQKDTKKEEKEPGIMDSLSEVIPSSQDYEKNMEKAFKI